MTTDLMVPSKRPRAPSFSEKHPHEYSTAGVSDWSQEKQIQVKNFLELCGFCKKKLSQYDDVFMYGYLGAFCSKKCREKQMVFDIFKELHSQGKSNPNKGRICLTNKPKDEEERIITPSSSSSTSTRFFI